MGLRDDQALKTLGSPARAAFTGEHAMPANNRLLVWTALSYLTAVPARNSQVSTTVSGFSDMLSMPCSTSQRAKSG